MPQPLPLLENEAMATRENFIENATAEKRAIIRALTELVDTVLGSGDGHGGSEEERRSSDKESGVGVFPSFSSAGWRRQERTGGPRRVAVS
ncbi:MAG: hypothetical protein AAGJ83_01595 [Planctomycetota bacterium]